MESDVKKRPAIKVPKRKTVQPSRSLVLASSPPVPQQADFDVVLRLIEASRGRAIAAVNAELVELYWRIGEHISQRIESAEWGQGTVAALAEHIQARHPGMTGFSARNLWRMRQFFEIYRDEPKLSPLVTQLSWTHNLLI